MTELKAKIATRHFLRIPGLGDERPSAELLINGEVLSVTELVGHLALPDPVLRLRAIDIMRHLSSPTRGEIHSVANALFCVSTDPAFPEAALCEVALHEFLAANALHPEALSIGSQLLRIREKRGGTPATPSLEALVSSLKDSLSQFTTPSSSATKQATIEARYVILRAFEVQQLRSIAVNHIIAFFSDSAPAMTTERKALAGQFLSTLRSLSEQDDSLLELTRIASCVFATGFLSSPSRPTPPPPPTVTFTPNQSQHENRVVGLVPTAAALVQRLVDDERRELVPRLLPQDFQVLRQVTGLSLEVFRLITERIRGRAASDPWARAAILDLVRSPHEPDVSARVRTAVLGALINDARRLGRLSTQLEKEVFAISAEIPDLHFLDHERTDPDDNQEVSPSTPFS